MQRAGSRWICRQTYRQNVRSVIGGVCGILLGKELPPKNLYKTLNPLRCTLLVGARCSSPTTSLFRYRQNVQLSFSCISSLHCRYTVHTLLVDCALGYRQTRLDVIGGPSCPSSLSLAQIQTDSWTITQHIGVECITLQKLWVDHAAHLWRYRWIVHLLEQGYRWAMQLFVFF